MERPAGSTLAISLNLSRIGSSEQGNCLAASAGTGADYLWAGLSTIIDKYLPTTQE